MIDKVKKNWPALTLIFFIFSLGGWLMETIGNIIFHGSVLDKGFLTMPICPIYGFAVLLLLVVVGLPFEGKWKDKFENYSGKKRIIIKGLTLIGYTIVATLIAVGFEFVVGQVYYMIFDIRLWHYQETADTFWNGFISREVSDAWFLMIMIAAPLVVTPLYRVVKKMKQEPLKIFSIILSSLIVIDFIVTVIFIMVTGDKINIFNFNVQ